MATAATFRPPRGPSTQGLVRRALGWFGAGLGTLLLFVAAVVLGVALHANTPAGRRLAMREVNILLAPSFAGQIRVERLGGLSVFGVRGADVTIDDPAGRPVIITHGVSARIATLAAARSALFGHGAPLTVELSDVAVDTIDVRLDTDADGHLDLATSFAPRAPAPATPAAPGARGFSLVARHVAWRHAWVHGRMTGAPPIDADVDELHGGITYAPDRIEGTVAGTKVVARGIANGADVVGLLRADVVAPSAPGAPVDGHVRWEGIAGGIEHSVTASMVNRRIDAVVDAPVIAPAGVRSFWRESLIEEPGSVHVEAHGPLADVDVALHARLGPASVDARGSASLEGAKSAKVSIDAREVDVHQIVAAAPRTRVGLSGVASAEMKADGALTAAVDLRFLGGSVGKSSVPAASIHGAGAMSAARQVTGTASVVVDEPGAPTTLDVELSPRGKSSTAEFAFRAASADLDQVPELKHAVRGRLRVTAGGEVDLGAMTIDARLRAAADGVVQGANRVASASLQGRVEGSLTDPRIDATLRGLGIQIGGLRFDSVYAHAEGGTTAARVTSTIRGPDTPDVDAIADVALESSVTLERLRMTLARRGALAVVTAREIEIGGGAFRVEDGRVEGMGGPVTATVAMTSRTLQVRAFAHGIDLARVARLGNLEKSVKTGLLSFDTDLALERDRGRGHLVLDLAQATLGTVNDVSGHAEISLDARRLACSLHAAAEGIGTVDVQAPTIELASGALTSGASWKQAWGAIDVDASADLGRMDALLPPEQGPLGRAHGKVHVKGHVARDGPRDFTPDLTLSVTTDQLALAARTPVSRDIDGVIVFPPPSWHVEGVDFDLDATIDGHTGALRVTTKARDARGPLAQLDVSAPHVPYDEVIHGDSKLATRLRTTPFEAHAVIPERGLGSVPAILRQSYVTGRLQADVKASGTMLSPVVDVTAALRRAHYAANGGRAEPLDVDVSARYDGQRATASVKARTAQHEMLDLEAEAQAAVGQLLDASAQEGDAGPAWKASARAHLTGFPLSSIAVLDDKLVSGQLSGDVTLADLHANARADADLTIDGLRVGSFAYRSAGIHLKADGRALDATVRIDQTDGFLEAKAHAVASWGTALAPVLDPGHPLDAHVSAKNFRIAALLPFLDGTLDELDGRVDAETSVQLDPTQNQAHASGTIALSRGTVEAAAGVGELHDITASVKLASDGTVTLEKLTARGLTGQLEMTGTAKLDGTSLRSAKAVVVIPGGSAVPLSASGTEIGNVDGRVELSELTSANGAMAVKVEVPRLRVRLPEGATTHVQALGAMPKVRIGAHRGDPVRFVLLPIDPVRKERAPSKSGSSPMTFDAHLGDVQVVRGTELAVDLDGSVRIVASGDSPQVTGQIHLKRGGTLDIQGKTFTVEQGTVTLVGTDPSDPEVVVKAGWTASDGTVVHATFDGPLKTGKVTLSSEPALPQQEIVQLLLFGTPDGAQAETPTGAPQNTAIGTAGGEAAQPLNHMLGQLGLGAVTTRVDTTQAANPRPEVEVQIARDISVQIAVVLGQPPPGVNPDHTLLTIDWRFFSRWSLASTVGDAGTTVFDLLWQRRY